MTAPRRDVPRPNPTARGKWMIWGWLLMAAAAAIPLLLGLPADGFYSGDSGVKLIAARSAILHPSRPFDVDLPSIAGIPAPYVDPFFQPHGDHTHPVQSAIFPVASAIPIGFFGLSGAYLLPLIGFLVLLPLLAFLRHRMMPDLGLSMLATITLFANPLFFYGFEFWEHAPAAACLAATTGILLSPNRPGLVVVGGVIGAVGVLLRPEAGWYLLALALVTWNVRTVMWLLLGSLVVIVPFAAFNLIHSGTIAGVHTAANLASLGDRWLETRWHHLDLWFSPRSPFVVVGALIAATGWILRHRDMPTRQAVVLVGAAVIAVGAASGTLNRESLWTACPAAALLLVPFRSTTVTRRLWMVAAVTAVAIVLTASNDGGAQWGPRYLLIATPLVLLLAAASAQSAISPGHIRSVRTAFVVVIVLCGAWNTRTAYRELRAAKQGYARLVNAVERSTEPGNYVVTNVWWLRQVLAALYPTREILFAASRAQATDILNRLEDASVSKVVLVWTGEPDGDTLRPTADATCYRVGAEKSVHERALRIANAVCS